MISPSELWPWRGYQKEIIRRHQCTSESRFAFYQLATVALGQPKTRLSTYGEKASCSTLRRVCKGYVDISRVQRHQPSNKLCHEARLALIAYIILNSTPTQADWSPASHSPQRYCLKCVRSISRRKGFAMMIPKFLQTAYCSRSPGKLQAPESAYPAHNGSGEVGY